MLLTTKSCAYTQSLVVGSVVIQFTKTGLLFMLTVDPALILVLAWFFVSQCMCAKFGRSGTQYTACLDFRAVLVPNVPSQVTDQLNNSGSCGLYS